MKRGVVVTIGFVALMAALLMLQFTSPQSAGPFGVLAFFILLYVFSVSFIYMALAAGAAFVAKYARVGKWRLAAEGASRMKLYYYASVVGLLPVTLLGMQTIGEVRPTDTLLLLLFQSIGCFYVHKRF